MPEPRKRAAPKKKTTAKKATPKQPSREAARRAASERPAKVTRARAASERPAPAASPAAVFLQKLQPSPELAAVVGKRPLSRVNVIKKLWTYIKRHKLQNQEDKKMIDTDEKLRAVYGDRPQVSMFELSSVFTRHLSLAP